MMPYYKYDYHENRPVEMLDSGRPTMKHSDYLLAEFYNWDNWEPKIQGEFTRIGSVVGICIMVSYFLLIFYACWVDTEIEFEGVKYNLFTKNVE